MIILSLEGNIGAGKSSLLRRVESRLPPGVKIHMEPVHLFQNFKGENPLKLFYQDPKEYAFFTQSHIIEAQCTYFCERVQVEPIRILLSERNLFSPIMFTNTFFKMGWLSQMETEKLVENSQKIIRNVLQNKPMGADYMFYLQEYPQVCQRRIRQRGREGENSITDIYLSQLESEYEDYCEKFAEKNGQFSLRLIPPTISRKQKEEALLDFIEDIIKKHQNVWA